MKKNLIFIASLLLLSTLTGYLLSSITFVGRLGINLFNTEYKFLKTWWKGGGLVLLVWLLLFGVHYLLRRRLTVSKYVSFSVASLVISLAGLFLSYTDFRHTLSHRWLGERFHLGVYLFWLGWIGIVLFAWLTRNTAAPDPLTEK